MADCFFQPVNKISSTNHGVSVRFCLQKRAASFGMISVFVDYAHEEMRELDRRAAAYLNSRWSGLMVVDRAWMIFFPGSPRVCVTFWLPF